MPATGPHVAIVGSGIVGSALAWRLARDGARVTVIDEDNPDNRATRGSFAWINAHRPDRLDYFSLRLEGMRLWREIADELPGLPARMGGSLSWEEPPETIEEVRRALEAEGNPARLVSKSRIAEMEPALAEPPEIAIETPQEGVVDPDRIAEFFLNAAAGAGATILHRTRALGFAASGDRITGVETDGDPIHADHVVVAAGKATPGLLHTLGLRLPMSTPAGLLIRTQPVPDLTGRVLTSLKLHLWQMPDGSLIVGEDFSGTPVGDSRAAVETRVLNRLNGYFKDIDGLRIEASTVAQRPTPGDGYPVIGRVPGFDGLSVATMHSGVTLAPAVAAHLSREILEETESDALSTFRFERFDSSTGSASA